MDDRTIVVAAETGGKLPSKKRIREYFTKTEESGGGIIDVLDVREDGTALITFRHTDDAANVELKNHELDSIKLIVYPFYGRQPELGTSEYDNTTTLSRQAKSPEKSNNQPTDHADLKTEEIPMQSGKIKLLQNFPPKDVQTMMKQFEECSIQGDKIVIKGVRKTFKDKIQKLKLALLNIKEETFDINKSFIYSLLKSKRGEQDLEEIEKKLQCVYQVDQGYYSSREENTEETSKEKQETDVTLVTGDLVDQEVDVLVSSVSSDLDLATGSTSSTLLQLGGDVLQRHCRERYPEGVQPKDVAKIQGGKLRCREVFFCSIPEFKDDANLKTFGAVIYKCLYEASEQGYTSIAFPALGTGHRGYPPHMVAKMMFYKISQFLSYATSLRDVRVIVKPGNPPVLKAFEDEKPSFLNMHDEKDADDSHESIVKRDQFRVGNLNIHFKQGEISREDSQAVVNLVSTASELHGGSNSSDLLAACGPEVDSQCQLAVSTLQKTGVAVTTAPQIPANYIIHVAVDHYKGSLKDVTKACLKTASERCLSSLGLPCLWTETDGMALKNIAKLFLKCLEDFEKKGSTLKDVSVVIQDETSCTVFLALMEDIIKKKVAKAKTRFSYRRRDMSSGAKGQVNGATAIEEVYVKQAKESDAEITIYSESREALSKAINEVEKLYESHFIRKTMECKQLKQLSKQKASRIKRKLEDLKVSATITWNKGLVEVEGIDDDVQELETFLEDFS